MRYDGVKLRDADEYHDRQSDTVAVKELLP